MWVVNRFDDMVDSNKLSEYTDDTCVYKYVCIYVFLCVRT